MNYNAIPHELKKLNQWVSRKGKLPINPRTGNAASAGKPETWSTFEDAVSQIKPFGMYDGIGFQFHNNGLVGIDLDTVRNPDTGYIAPDALEIIHNMNSYTEISPSGYGFHIIARADITLQWHKNPLPDNGIERYETVPKTGERKRKKPEIEMYTGGRYFTMTGDVFETYNEITEQTEQANKLHNRWRKIQQQRPPVPVYLPDSQGKKDFLEIGLKKDSKLRSLWDGSRPNGNESADDQGLMNKLAYWCNCDTNQMIAAFRQSPHYATKDGPHKKKCSRVDYLQRSAQEAVEKCSQTAENSDWNYRQSRRQQAEQEFKVLIGNNGPDILDRLKPDINPRYKRGDIGNAALFADVFKHRARCVFETRQWYVFDGQRWIKDCKSLKVMELCKDLADSLMKYAVSLPEDEHSKEYIKEVMKWRSLSKRKTIIEDAASVYPVRMAEFDSNPYLFNCKNGTLDLETGSFRKHSPSDMLTMLSGAAYHPNAKCTRWEQFIEEVMQGDAEKALFFQKCLGYTLTGDTTLECFFILYGATTRNGKGTAMETFKRLMGDYGAAASPETIAQKKNRDSGRASEDVARLAGKRLVNLSEPDQSMVLSSATVKTMTGNDTINARFLHENSFEFVPQFKLIINTNHLPRVTDPTVFSSDRVKVIPFERHFAPEEQDKTLKRTLMKPDNLSGILNWCIEGLHRMQREGLTPPASVAMATNNYQQSNDKMALFFSDRVEADPQGEIVMETLYEAYKSWCCKNGFMTTARSKFNQEIERQVGGRGAIRKKRPKGYDRSTSPMSMLLGYKLLPETIDFSLNA